jgi:hypothetical protein
MTLTPETIARRHALGIPVHETDAEHEWRADGYCNCGEARPKVRKEGTRRTLPSVVGRTTPRTDLDIIERNEDRL